MFSYSEEIAETAVKMGFYIGIGGVLTFKNAAKIKEVVKKYRLTELSWKRIVRIFHRSRFGESAIHLCIFPMWWKNCGAEAGFCGRSGRHYLEECGRFIWFIKK